MSGYRITANYPNVGKGQELSIAGLGTIKNGQTAEVTKEQAAAFKIFQRDLGMPDRTLLEAFKGNEYVEVETADVKDSSKVQVEGAPSDSSVVSQPDDSTVHTTDDEEGGR